MKDFFIKSKKDCMQTAGQILDLPYWIKISIVVVMVLICISFRVVNHHDKMATVASFEGILRNEYLSANSYALSKTLSDLELIKIVSCSVLIEKSDSNRVYYDTSSNASCAKASILKDLFEYQIDLVAINGSNYEIKFQLPLRWSLLLFEITTYVLVLIFLVIFAKTWGTQKANSEIKIKALELEKELVVDMANQVRHDVASPITALRTIVKVLNNIDPEIKEFLNRAVDRTESVFNQLSRSTEFTKAEIDAIDLDTCIAQMIKEKEILWKDNCQIFFKAASVAENRAFANLGDLNRIISNLLNNAFESAVSSQFLRIQIEVFKRDNFVCILIRDNGKGIPEDILNEIGTKGLSFGKEEYQGSGLGVYHAMGTLRYWGGDLIFESKIGKGTAVTIQLKAV